MTASASPAQPKPKFSWLREIRQWVFLILIVLGVHSFIAKPFYIPSESMVPTLLVGDRLIVSKYPYGFSYLSPSIQVLPKMKGRLFGRMPDRGDIAVLKSPSDGSDWIKRVIGLPGDTVELRNGAIILNGRPLARTQVGNTKIKVSPNSHCAHFPKFLDTDSAGNAVCSYPTFRETLPNGRSYLTFDIANTPRDNFGPATVPAGTLFFLGDNRDNSQDSRVPPEIGGLGMVPVENLVGRAEFTTFSVDGSQTLNPITWIKALRRDRAFNSLR